MTTRDDATQADPAPDEAAENEGPAGFRDKLKRTEDTLGKAQQSIRKAAFRELGVKDETGMAKAIDKAYEGDWTDIDEVVDFAREEFSDIFNTPDEANVERLREQESRIDTMRTASSAVDEQDYEARLNQQREDGNVRGSILEQTRHFYSDRP